MDILLEATGPVYAPGGGITTGYGKTRRPGPWGHQGHHRASAVVGLLSVPQSPHAKCISPAPKVPTGFMPLNRLPGFLNLMGTKPKCERGPPDAASLSLSTSKTRQIICLRHSRRAVVGQAEGTSHGHFSRKRIKRRVRRNRRSTETLTSSQPGARAGFRFEARAQHSAALRSAFLALGSAS